MTHTKQKHVQVDLQDIPQEIMENHGEVTLAIDVMFINKIPFVMTTSYTSVLRNKTTTYMTSSYATQRN